MVKEELIDIQEDFDLIGDENGLENGQNGLNNEGANGTQINGSNGHSIKVENVQVSSLLNCSYPEEKREEQRTEFSFETDHEALRGNTDYTSVLKTLAVLQAQKVQAVKDLEVLIEAKNEALKDPLALIERLQRGEDLKLPGKQVIAKVPEIEWSKYGLSSLSQNALVQQASYQTRESRKAEDPSKTRHHDELGPLKEVKGLGCKVEKTNEGQYLVRGRLFDGKKPKTFNQPWTAEEQKRLEELLHEYPSEEIEMDRWKKIANRLGNRTPVQVQSRIQKYFLKLHKAGLPIPGRLGKQARNTKKHANTGSSGMANFNKGAVNQFINNKQMYSTSLIGQRHSTFFPHLKPDITMTEEEEKAAGHGLDMDQDTTGFWSLNNDLQHLPVAKVQSDLIDDFVIEMEDVSDEEGVPEELKKTEDYKELMWLKRIRREKEFEQRENDTGKPISHLGFRCDLCNQDPIVGPRFTCVDCMKNEASVDLCAECAPKIPTIEPDHTEDHTLRAARKTYLKQQSKDNEYVIRTGSYLDPNYQYFK